MTVEKNDRVVPFNRFSGKRHFRTEAVGPFIAERVSKAYVVAKDRFGDKWNFPASDWKLKVIMQRKE
jgi:hypothetical protein